MPRPNENRPRKTLGIVGYGGLGYSLVQHFARAAGWQLDWVLVRDAQKRVQLRSLWPGLRVIGQLAEAPSCPDFVCLAVPDRAVAPLAAAWAQLDKPNQATLLLHGASLTVADADAYPGPKAMVYPLQTFSFDKAVDWAQVPVFLEVDAPEGLSFAHALGGPVVPITPDERLQVHLAGVFANNYANLMVRLAHEVLPLGLRQEAMQYLRPLLEATFQKWEVLSPAQAQTGPALRGDAATLARHRAWLAQHHPDWILIYDAAVNLLQVEGPEAEGPHDA